MGGCVSTTARKDVLDEEAQKKHMVEMEMRRREEMECKLERRGDISFKPKMELRPSGIKNPKPTTDFGF